MNGNQLPDDFFINDGYTVKAAIKARPGLHGELRFTYRPGTLEERETEYSGRGQTAKGAIKSMSELLAKKLEGWSIDGFEPTAANIVKLKPSLFDRLFAVVVGLSPDDSGQQVDVEADAKN